MRLSLRLSVLALLVILVFSCKKEEKKKKIPVRVNVSDVGILPGTGENMVVPVNRLIDSLQDDVPVTLIFPQGRYDFYPDSLYLRTYFETNTYDINPKRLAILIDKKKNITIDARGSDFVFHDHIQPFTLDHAENITIRNVNIDWDQPLTAQAKVLETSASHILVQIDTVQFPYTVFPGKVVFHADSWKADWRLSGGSWLIEVGPDHIIPPATGDMGCVNGDLKNVVYEAVAPGLLKMSGKFTKTPAVGNYLIMRHSTRDHAGMFFFHSKDIKLENVNVYHTSGLGILSQYCENIRMHKVNMIPNSKKNRYFSGHDDGLHFMGCRGEIDIDDCDAVGLMDDPVNVHGTYVPVVERLTDSVLLCNYAHKMSSGLIWAKPGDKVGFVRKKDMVTKGTAVVKSFRQLNKDSFEIVFESEIPVGISQGYSLENLSCVPDVTIANCYVGSNRARGYLISTPGKVLIKNNIFETSGSAILIAGDANYWYESGAVRDIRIMNNEFKAACNSSPYQFCKAVISIYPEIPEPDPERPYHQDIRISNNSFAPSDYPVLYARSVEGLFFTGNTIKRSYEYQPWQPNKATFNIGSSKNVVISGNKISKDVLGRNILLEKMARSELQLDDDSLKVLIR